MKRRHFHRAAWALALQPWLLPVARANGSPPRWSRNPFSLGVASGQPRPDSVVIWTRLLPDAPTEPLTPLPPLEVGYEVYADAALTKRVQTGHLSTDASRAHSVHGLLQGLQPDRHYWYRFTCGDAISPVGHTRTAPAPDAVVQRLDLALASCQHYEQGYYAAHRDIARQDLDLVLFVGDYIYESSNPNHQVAPGVRLHPPKAPMNLEQYRQHHALYKRDLDLQAAHAAHPWLITWDDHDVVNDYAAEHDPGGASTTWFLKRRAAAYQAFFEHMPLRLGPDGAGSPNMRIYDQMAWGQLADVWTLDCRQYRSLQACPDPTRGGGGRVVLSCDALDDASRTLLGAEQERWLAQGLAASKRQWRVIAQSTLIAPSGVNTPLGRTTYTDAWDGYPKARERLLQTIVDAKLRDVVTLGGDVHMNVASNLRLRPNDEKSPIVASEFVTTSISSRGMSEVMLNQIRASNPDIAYARSDERGYTKVSVTPPGRAS